MGILTAWELWDKKGQKKKNPKIFTFCHTNLTVSETICDFHYTVYFI